jgi:hypothetical protein
MSATPTRIHSCDDVDSNWMRDEKTNAQEVVPWKALPPQLTIGSIKTSFPE